MTKIHVNIFVSFFRNVHFPCSKLQLPKNHFLLTEGHKNLQEELRILALKLLYMRIAHVILNTPNKWGVAYYRKVGLSSPIVRNKEMHNSLHTSKVP